MFASSTRDNQRLNWIGWSLLVLIMLGFSGCAAFSDPAPEKPRTVNDWMKGERLGSDLRPAK